MKKFFAALVLSAFVLCALTPFASAYIDASSVIHIYYQQYSSKNEWSKLDIPGGEKMGTSGCLLFANAHAVQWLTKTKVSDTSLLKELIADLDNALAWEQGATFFSGKKTLSSRGLGKGSGTISTSTIKSILNGEKVVIANTSYKNLSKGHWVVAVDWTERDINGDGKNELLILIVDSAMQSTYWRFVKETSSDRAAGRYARGYAMYDFSTFSKITSAGKERCGQYWVEASQFINGMNKARGIIEIKDPLKAMQCTSVDSTQRIGISLKASTADDTCRLQSVPYDDDKYNISILEKDTIVNIIGAVDNKYGNRWYIVENENGNRLGYVFSGDVEVCLMEKVTAYVTSTKKRTFNDKDDQCYAKALPYESSWTMGIMDKGEGFGVDARITNKHGNVWYRLTNGWFVYNGDVTLTTYTEDWEQLCELRADFTHNESVNSHLLPYADSPKRASIFAGETVTVEKLVTNKHGNIWAQLDDGSYLCFYDKAKDETYMTFDRLTDGFTETASKPTGHLTQGKGFELTGTIKANAPIYQVTAYVLNDPKETNALPPVSVKPGNFAYSANLNKKYNGVNINYSVIFNDLPVGWFRYVVTAQLGFTYSDKLFLLGDETVVVDSPFAVGNPTDEELLPDIPVTPIPTTPVERIEVTNEVYALLYGMPYEFQWNVYPSNATNSEVTWTSSNEDVLQLRTTENGVEVYYVGVGSTTITVSANDDSGVSHSFDTYVIPAVDCYWQMNSEILVGRSAYGTLVLSTNPALTKIIIQSSDESILNVKWKELSPGQYEIETIGNAPGKAYVEALVYVGDEQSRVSYEVNVREPIHVESINLYGLPNKMYVGDTAGIYYTFSPSNNDCDGSSVTSSDPSIIEVRWQDNYFDEYGNYIWPLRAHAPGKATITVAALDGSGITTSFTITVIDSRLPGDTNVDGTVNITDALLLLQYAAGENISINTSNADVNTDGMADIYDALLILQYDAGWNVTLK